MNADKTLTSAVGVNWRTTLAGILTALFAIIAEDKTLIAFLPDATGEVVYGICKLGWKVTLALGFMATKDRTVSGNGTTTHPYAK